MIRRICCYFNTRSAEGVIWTHFHFCSRFFIRKHWDKLTKFLTLPNVTHIYSTQISEAKRFLLLKPWTVIPRKPDEVTLTHNILVEQKFSPRYFYLYPRNLNEIGCYWPLQFSSVKYSVFDHSCSYYVLYYVRDERTSLVRPITSH